MEIIKLVMQSKTNLKTMGIATGSGLLLGLAASTLTAGEKNASVGFESYQYLKFNEEVLDHLEDLQALLLINSQKLPGVFHELCATLNVLVGYDYLIDTGRPLKLDLNYTVQEISHYCYGLLGQTLKLPFRISTVGADVCQVVEKLQEYVSNVVFNMNQEIRVRVMDGKF